MHAMLSQCWHAQPRLRPSAGAIAKTLSSAKPSKLSVLDCMMAAVENYAGTRAHLQPARAATAGTSAQCRWHVPPKQVRAHTAAGTHRYSRYERTLQLTN